MKKYPSMEPRARFGYHIKAKFGITLEEYEHLFLLAGNCCQICDRPVTQAGQGKGRGDISTGVVDHCHKTGRVRGILCRVCNSFLGVIGEDLSRVENYMKG